MLASSEKTNTTTLLIGASVVSVAVTVSGGIMALVSLPFGVATVGLGLFGVVTTAAVSYLPV